MSQKKGNIPFSWEEKPGVLKESNRESHSDAEEREDLSMKSAVSSDSESSKATGHGVKIPPPPFLLQEASHNAKGIRWEDDPFLVAYTKCTKAVKSSDESRKKKKKKKWSSFSCTNSGQIVEDCVVKVSQLPRDNRIYHLHSKP